MWSWGAGSCGQLGAGLAADSIVPVKATTLVTLQQISCGGNHVAAVSDGSPVVWGNTKAIGVCEVAASREVLPVPMMLPASLFGMQQIQTVSAGWGHTAFVTGTPTCMPRRPTRSSLTAALQIASSLDFPAITLLSVERKHLQRVRVTGKLFTAGEGAFGQLGLGECVPIASTPVHVLGELATCRVYQVACGMHHTLVLGRVQLGHGSHLPACEVSRGSDASTLSIFAFGANRRGQIGIKMPQPSSAQQNQTYDQSDPRLPVEQQHSEPADSRRCRQTSVTADAITPSKVWEPCLVADLQHGASPCKILAGGHHSGIIDTSGCLHLWGRSYTSHTNVSAPEQVSRPKLKAVQQPVSEDGHLPSLDDSCHKWVEVSLGWSHVLALDDKGCVWAWGSNKYGQCGQPIKPDQATDNTAAQDNKDPHSSHTRRSDTRELIRRPTQIQAPNMQCVSQLSAGSEHSAALTVDGKVFAWGWGEHGQLGVGNTHSMSQPTQVQVPLCEGVFCGSGFTAALQAS